MEGVRIRVAKPEDDAVIAALLVESFVGTYARKMPEVVVSERRIRDLNDVASKRTRAYVSVAEVGGEILGSGTLFQPGDPISKAWTPQSAEIRYFAVAPKAQGQGVAKVLLQDMILKAKSWGCQGICLHVRRGAVGVAKFYVSHGFVRSPEGDADLLPEIFLEAYRLALN